MESLGTGARGGLEGGYEPCAPFLTRQERRLEEGWKGATSLALLFWLGKNGGWKAGWKGATSLALLF